MRYVMRMLDWKDVPFRDFSRQRELRRERLIQIVRLFRGLLMRFSDIQLIFRLVLVNSFDPYSTPYMRLLHAIDR